MKSFIRRRQLDLLCTTLVLLSSRLIANAQPGATGPSDHLIPPSAEIDTAYRSLLSQKLFVTPANYARIVVMPSSAAGERAIALYSETQATGEKNVLLTCTKADKNLWYSTSQSNPNRGNERPVEITRKDAPFPKSTAVAVSQALHEMLARTKPLERESRIVLDGTDVEFEVPTDARTPIRGLLTPYAQGVLTAALQQLTKQLSNYCDAEPAERERVAREIEAEANRLLEALRSEKPKAR